MIQQSCTKQCYFGTMHITLRMAIMLSIVGAFERRWWLLNGGFCWQGWKPVVGNKNKACTRALGFKNRKIIIIFRVCMFRQRMLADSSIAFLSRTSFEERLPSEDHNTLLISFVYHCQSFLISHRQSVKEDSCVVLSFMSRVHSMPVPSHIKGLHIIHAIQG